jgi:uncharacterized protein (TIGR02145 family)
MKTILLIVLIIISTFLFAQVTDIDGNVYGTVKVGSKTWMTENLRVTKLNTGTAITFNISTDTAKASIWTNYTIPAYCWMNDDKSVAVLNKYGALYNYHAVYTGKLCPTGWHVPTRVEFDSLIKQMDGANNAGRLLKSTTGWKTRNGVDKIGFNAKPAGDRWCCYQNTTILAEWWTSEQFPNPYPMYPYGFTYTYMMLDFYDWFYQSNYNQVIGAPVRCVK